MIHVGDNGAAQKLKIRMFFNEEILEDDPFMEVTGIEVRDGLHAHERIYSVRVGALNTGDTAENIESGGK